MEFAGHKKIKKSIFTSTKKLINNPLIGALEENLKDLNQEYRYLVEGNYKIIYIIINDSVFITDIFDCRQNPEKMKK